MVVRARPISSKGGRKGLSLKNTASTKRINAFAAPAAEAAANGASKWSKIIFDYIPCGAFSNSVRYGRIMRTLNDYIYAAEQYKETLSQLDASKLEDAVGNLWDFTAGHKTMMMQSIASEETRKELEYLLDTATTVIVLQCIQLIEKRADELGVRNIG